MNLVPCILLTGFLGSGKTTFLNWLIHTHPNLKISVILNEFGDIKLESNFVKEHTEGIIELANGCMCCVAKADIPRVVSYILDHSPQTEYIIIEASGLSDPDPIHEAFNNPEISTKVFLHSIICLVDAINFTESRKNHRIVMNQIADCDIAILTKVQLATRDQLQTVRDFFNTLPNTRLIEFSHHLDPNQFMTFEPRPESSEPETEHTHEAYQTWWYMPTGRIDSEKLKTALLQLPESVVRAKGFFQNLTGEKQLLQLVEKSVEIIPASWGEGENPRTALLFIGKELNHQQLIKILDSSIGIVGNKT